MVQDDETRDHRHPDAVAYLEGLGEESVAMVRAREGGYTRYWLQDGEVRSLEVSEDRPLEALLAAGDRCRHFQNNIERMQYDGCSDKGMQIGGSGVEGGCRQFGLRLKRTGTRWSERGANAMLALKTCVMNLRVPDFLEWRTNEPVAA